MVATAESCTGGMVAAALTDIPGSSDVVERGFVTYSNAAKTELLGVPAELIAAHGAVSEPVARAMAEGALAAQPRRARRRRHRHRRPRRRHGRQARGPRALRLRPARPADRPRPDRVRRHRPRSRCAPARSTRRSPCCSRRRGGRDAAARFRRIPVTTSGPGAKIRSRGGDRPERIPTPTQLRVLADLLLGQSSAFLCRRSSGAIRGCAPSNGLRPRRRGRHRAPRRAARRRARSGAWPR